MTQTAMARRDGRKASVAMPAGQKGEISISSITAAVESEWRLSSSLDSS